MQINNGPVTELFRSFESIYSTKEICYGSIQKKKVSHQEAVRIALNCGLPRKQVASDLGIAYRH